MKKILAASFCTIILIFSAGPIFPVNSLQSKSKGNRKTPVKTARDVENLKRALQEKVDELYKSGEFPGINAAAALADGRTAAVSAGVSDAEKNTPLSPNDLMLAGSIGKTYAAAVAIQLVQEGVLNLDDKIEKWFGREKWFKRLPNGSDITLRMLMNHTSGIPEHVLKQDFIAALKENPDKIWSGEETIKYILDSDPLFPAGKGWSYADTNYILVGMIIERGTKNAFYRELDKRILKPLRLNRTLPSDKREIAGLITGYSRPNSPFGFEGRVISEGKFVINPQFEWTGGGLATTAEDLARWAKAVYEGRVFDKRYLVDMFEGVEASTGKGDKYGLGVQIRQSPFGVSYGHGGWFPGYLSEMEYFPQYGFAVAVQFNTDAMRKIKRPLRTFIEEIANKVISEQSSLQKSKRAEASKN